MSLCVPKLSEVNYTAPRLQPSFKAGRTDIVKEAAESGIKSKSKLESAASTIGWILMFAALIYGWVSSFVEDRKEKVNSEIENTIPQIEASAVQAEQFFDN